MAFPAASPELPSLSKPSSSMKLGGRYYIITGAAQGIGEAVAISLASAGASGITLVDIDAVKGPAVRDNLITTRGPGFDVIFVHEDLSSAEAPGRVLAAHAARFGRCDGLVNCAASTARGTWDETTAEMFDQIFALNVRAPFLLMQGACRLMEQNGTRGSIVNIGSVHAHGGMPKLAAYAGSKGALLTLTKNLAFAKRRQGIRANYIALGWTATPREHEVNCYALRLYSCNWTSHDWN